MNYLYIHDDKDMTIVNKIISNQKTVETRPKNVLKKIVGDRVGLVVTLPNRKRLLFGYATIGKPVTYHNEGEFNADFGRHCVSKDSVWFKQTGVGYELIDPVFIPMVEAPAKVTGNRSYYQAGPNRKKNKYRFDLVIKTEVEVEADTAQEAMYKIANTQYADLCDDTQREVDIYDSQMEGMYIIKNGMEKDVTNELTDRFGW